MSVCPAGSFQHLYKLKDSNSGMAVIVDGNCMYGLSHTCWVGHMAMWVTAAVLSSSTLAACTFVNAHRLFMRAVKRVANTCCFQTAAAAAAGLLLLCARCDGSPRYFNLVSCNPSLCTSQCMGVISVVVQVAPAASPVQSSMLLGNAAVLDRDTHDVMLHDVMSLSSTAALLHAQVPVCGWLFTALSKRLICVVMAQPQVCCHKFSASTNAACSMTLHLTCRVDVIAVVMSCCGWAGQTTCSYHILSLQGLALILCTCCCCLCHGSLLLPVLRPWRDNPQASGITGI